MRKVIIICAIVAAVALFASMMRPTRHEGIFYPMGGIPFRVIAYERSGLQFKSDVGAAEQKVGELEEVFNSHRASSEVSRLNRETGEARFAVSADMRRVLTSAREWWKRTGGAFDVTVGPLIDLWQGAGRRGKLPAKSEIENALRSVGMEMIEIEDDQIRIKIKNMEIGLGGIAKGDVVDRVAMLMRKRGVKRGIVQAGGDTLAFGKGTFLIGIQDPTATRGAALVGEVEMTEGAIVTSGNYERFVEIDGKRYSHIIDPRSGMPVDNGLVSVTVTAPACIDADALATALTVMGRERAIELLRNEPAYEGILIEKTADKYIVWVDSGLKDRVHFEEPWGNSIRTF